MKSSNDILKGLVIGATVFLGKLFGIAGARDGCRVGPNGGEPVRA